MTGGLDESIYNRFILSNETCIYTYNATLIDTTECTTEYWYGAKALLDITQEISYVVIICVLAFVAMRILFFSK